MKTLLTTIYLYSLLSLSSFANTTVISLIVDGGDWKDNSSWDLNRIPNTGDRVIIPAGKTVIISTNQYNSVPSYPLIDIEVYGVLQFVGTGQLNVKCESTICTKVNGSIPSTGCNCNQITMGPGLAPWKGSYPSVTNGQCVLSDCNTSLPIESLFFEALVENETVLINWAFLTEIEGEIETIELERSSDALNYSSIYSFTPKESQKSYTDYNAPKSTTYYRLKVNYSTGEVSYSVVKKVDADNFAEVNAYPNPTTESNLNLSCPMDLYNALISLSIQDQYGSVLSAVNYTRTSTGIHVEPSNALSSGLYTIILSTNTASYTAKVVIQ